MIRTFRVVIATALVAGVAFAQTGPTAAPAPPAETASVPEPEPELIPVPEVMGRAAETEEELRGIEALAELDSIVAGIAGELPETRTSIEAHAAEATERLQSPAQIRNLGDLRNRWLLERAGLESWNETLTARARRIEERVLRLGELAETWEKARAELRDAKAPDAVLERIGAVLSRVAKVRKKVEERRADVLDTQAEIAALIEVVNDVAGRIDAAKGEITSRLLGADAPPLWTQLAQGRMDSATREREWRELRRDFEIAADYVSKRVERIAIHLLLIAVGTGLLLVVRRRAAGWAADDADLQASAEVLSRPYACAVLVGVFASPFVYLSAPSVIGALIGLISLIPVLRLIPPLLDTTALPTFRALAVVFFVDCVRDLIVPAATLERVIYVVELCYVVAVFARLLRRDRLALLSSPIRFPPFAATLIRLAAGVLILAVGANVLGSTDLSLLLGEGVLRSAYVAVGFYAVYRVMSGMLALALRSDAGRRLNMIRRHRALMATRTLRLFRVVAVLSWLSFALGKFEIRDQMLELARSALAAELIIGELGLSLGSVFSFGVVLTVAVYFSRLLRFVLEEDVLPRMNLARGVPYAVTATIHYTILFLGLLAALAAMGIDIGKFSILAGALGVGVGFGLQNVVNNFVSGLILLFERPIQTGDVVEVGSLLGEVRRIGIRASTVRTLDGAEVIVPNANLISDQVVNWTLSDRHRRIDVAVGVKYGTDPERVLALLLQVAAEDERVLSTPEPDALFLGFGDSSLDFTLRAWTGHFGQWKQVHSDLNVAVNRALAEAEIEIPFPQRDLHVRSVSEGVGDALKPSDADD